MSRAVTTATSTGTGAISATFTADTGAQLIQMTWHADSAPTTGDAIEVNLGAADGTAYDTLLFSYTPSTTSATDVVWTPDWDLRLKKGDTITATFTNTDGNTIGLMLYYDQQPRK